MELRYEGDRAPILAAIQKALEQARTSDTGGISSQGDDSPRADNKPPIPPFRIVIDGPSGSGKSTLAQELASDLGAIVVNSDEWVGGWEGLLASRPLTEDLLTGRRADYPRWNWETSEYDGTVTIDPNLPWIVEGCGTLTPATAAAATLSLWVETDPAEAKARGLARDGGVYAPFWDVWNAQEREHWRLHDPRTLADMRIST